MSTKVAELVAELGVEFDKRKATLARKQLGQFAKKAEGDTKKSGGRLSRAFNTPLKGLTRTVDRFGKAGLLGAVVGSGVVIKDVLNFDAALTKFDVNSNSAAGSVDEVRSKVLATSTAFGQSKEDVLAAAAGFTAYTGDGKTAIAALDTFAKVATASGTPMKDIAEAGGAMGQNFGISADQMEKAFSILIAGGKAGSVELEDMSTIFRELAPAMTQFAGGEGIAGIAGLNAALQATNTEFGSLAEASTGFERFVESLTPADKKFRKLTGAESFFEKAEDGSIQLKSMEEVIDQLDKSGIIKDPTKLQEIFPNVRARKFVRTLIQNRDQYKEIERSSRKANDAQTDFDKVSSSASFKARQAWTELKNVLTNLFIEAAPLAAEFLKTVTQGLKGVITLLGGALQEFRELGGVDTLKENVKEFLAGEGPAGAQAASSLVREAIPGGGLLGAGAKAEQIIQNLPNLIDARGRAQQAREGLSDIRRVFPEFATPSVRALERAEVAERRTADIKASITINAPNADAKEVQRLVNEEMLKQWRRAFQGAE